MKHRIGLTVTDPNHPMVSKRKEEIAKTVRVPGAAHEREKAINTAIAHMKRKGYKVHAHHYLGMVNEGSDKLQGTPVVSLSDFGDKDNTKDRYGRTVPKKLKKDDPRVKFHKEPKKQGVSEAKSTSGAYEKSEENKRSADAAKKQGDMFAHHLHMADYHDNLAQWHSEEGRHNTADIHAEKSEKHQEEAMKHKNNMREEKEQLDELSPETEHSYFKKRYDQEPNRMNRPKKTRQAMDRVVNNALKRNRLEWPKGTDPSEGGKYTADSVEHTGTSISETDTFPVGHDGKSMLSKAQSRRNSAESKARSISQQGVNKSKADAMKDVKEAKKIKVCPKCGHNPCQCDSMQEAWNVGSRNPQTGIKVGHKVRSYDFPGMHDDHYIEGHVVGETPHSYHIRVNKVVRSGKEIPTPTHMNHVEAPKGKGMIGNAYAVHKILDKQQSVSATPEAPRGAAKTFDQVRKK